MTSLQTVAIEQVKVCTLLKKCMFVFNPVDNVQGRGEAKRLTPT